MKISRERVNSLALVVSDAIKAECHKMVMDLPKDFENEFHIDLEELLAQAYGDPDYANYN